jgi:hypothetical protein
MFQFILGLGLAAFTIGGLTISDSADRGDPLPQWAEAVIIGAAFALAAAPWRWAIAFRTLMPLPTFLIYLMILEARTPPMPFGAAFLCAGMYALFLTAYTAYLAERGRRRNPDDAPETP